MNVNLRIKFDIKFHKKVNVRVNPIEIALNENSPYMFRASVEKIGSKVDLKKSHLLVKNLPKFYGSITDVQCFADL
jgi:hypothetical protein